MSTRESAPAGKKVERAAALDIFRDVPTRDINAFFRVRARCGDLMLLRYLASSHASVQRVEKNADPRHIRAAEVLHERVDAAVLEFARAINATMPPSARGEEPPPSGERLAAVISNETLCARRAARAGGAR